MSPTVFSVLVLKACNYRNNHMHYEWTLEQANFHVNNKSYK